MSKTTLVRTSSSLTARGALLQVLARGPGFGAELVVRLKDITAGGVTIGYSSVYPPLRELEIDGLVRSFADPHPETKYGGHPRRFFELTELGLAEAAEQKRIILLLLCGSDTTVPHYINGSDTCLVCAESFPPGASTTGACPGRAAR